MSVGAILFVLTKARYYRPYTVADYYVVVSYELVQEVSLKSVNLLVVATREGPEFRVI